ncbi:uncharacterized protein LOC123203906 isoform X3 [Mangifera indica]|uniref:uncharacterized protein LOC123203906 isoform X3 n=1 Tax=Mangifera indica TaxID=29780 RepID=UPI001CFAD3B4|nr:uncharacterized protein LOC123203906 isoform X3 [Mangifera indica]
MIQRCVMFPLNQMLGRILMNGKKNMPLLFFPRLSSEKLYMEDFKVKSKEQVKNDGVEESSKVRIIPKSGAPEANQQKSKTSASSTTEQDLDVFLLGGDSDKGPDDGDEVFDDDFDKMVDGSDDEKEKSEKITELSKTS